MSVFDGNKTICVAMDVIGNSSKEDLIKNIPVMSQFDEIITIQNNPTNRESESLLLLLESVMGYNHSMTFYAHNKGKTWQLDSILKNWILSMYYFNLEEPYLSAAEQAVGGDYVVSGILKKDCQWEFSDWHYSGAFFWFNTEKLFHKNWKDFSTGRMALESYLGRRVDSKEAFCTFVTKSFNFHIDNDLWNTEIRPDTIGEESFNKYSSLLNFTGVS
jgi:hypothetical protein